MVCRLPLFVAVVALVASACTADETDPVSVTTVSSASTPTESTSTSATAPSSVAPEPSGDSATTSIALEGSTTSPPRETRLSLESVATGFAQPVLVTHPPGDRRLFVVDQPGRIWVIGDGDPEVFLDIRDEVSFGGERGLLGMAFHPDYADNGRFFVNHIDMVGATRVVEFTVSGDSDVADRTSGRVLLAILQPAGNHNGGMIAFGPDGLLWIGMGDGGASADRFGNGQRPETLLGSMLRIDVDSESDNPYEIPADNPYTAGEQGAPEVWAIGVRNPWRFSFDGDDLWIGDVGQGAVEEIDRVSALDPALNYGWPIYEGSACFGFPADCTGEGFTFPVHEYDHGDGCSVTGGYVYRGAALPELDGHYFFSDFCSGFIRSIAPDGEVFDWTDDTGSVEGVTSFGVDVDGEIYVVSGDGMVFKIAHADA